MLIELIGWLIFGLIIGAIAKFITPGKDPKGWLPTICIGVLGSYFGGVIKMLLVGNEFSPSGLVFSVIGSVIFLVVWRRISDK